MRVLQRVSQQLVYGAVHSAACVLTGNYAEMQRNLLDGTSRLVRGEIGVPASG